MPRRKSPYPDKPHVMRPEIRARFKALMAPDKRNKEEVKWVPQGGWQLWRWDSLEDVSQDLTCQQMK